MVYQVYTTRALVCGSFDRNTSDRYYYFFTEDAGMVLAHAKSVREEKSKHRYALQDFSLVDVSLVRGRTGWKVTGSVPRENVYFESDSRERRAMMLRIIALVRRLVQGEERHADLFNEILDGLHATKDAEAETLEQLEQLLTLRMLYALGYVAPTSTLENVLEAKTLIDAHEAVAASPQPLHRIQSATQKAIDEALHVAQL